MTVLNDDALSAYYGPDRLEAIYYGSEKLKETRTNYCLNPRGIQTGVVGSDQRALGFAQYSSGTNETGSTVFLTEQTDGPVAGITSYGRRIVTARKTSSSTGWTGTSVTDRPAVVGKAGDLVRVSMWQRQIGSSIFDPRLRIILNSAGGQTSSDQPAFTSLFNGVWTYFEHTMIAASDFQSISWWNYLINTQAPSAGSTFDLAGIYIGLNDTDVYKDGTFPEWMWSAAPDASSSSGW